MLKKIFLRGYVGIIQNEVLSGYRNGDYDELDT
jgi:hypothetical protein